MRWEPSCSLRTDRRDEANKRFSQFCEGAKTFYAHLQTFVKIQCKRRTNLKGVSLLPSIIALPMLNIIIVVVVIIIIIKTWVDCRVVPGFLQVQASNLGAFN
jgi:uncharacterized membrane protein